MNTVTNRLPRASFAPPLTDELLAKYDTMISALPNERAELRDAMRECYVACELWWGLPESDREDGERFNVKRGGETHTLQETPLTAELVKQLDSSVPYARELDAIQLLFDEIPVSEKDLRNCAFHLLWHVRELCLDREPFTADKLPS